MFSGIQKNIRHLFRPGAPLRSRNKKRKQEEAIGRSHDGFTRKPRSERSSLLAPPQQPLRLAEALRRELMASTRPPCQASPHRSVPAPPAPHSAVGQHRFIISYPPFPVEHTSARCPISRTTSKGIVSGRLAESATTISTSTRTPAAEFRPLWQATLLSREGP